MNNLTNNIRQNYVILAGGSGFLGEALAKFLVTEDYKPIVLTRSPKEYKGAGHPLAWDGKTVGPWAAALNGAAAVINLTGKSVDCRYTPENRREIIASRVDSVRAIGHAITQCAEPPPVWIQAGSLAIFGDAQDRVCDETAQIGQGFSVEVCQQWEKAFAEFAKLPTRRVFLRIGFVLGRDGGALDKLAGLTKWMLGGATGSGKQYISWMHIQDFNRMCFWAIENQHAHGTYNATCPNPLTNAEFMRALRKTLHRPWSPPVPEFAVRIGARLMGTEAELALTGRRCIPQRLLSEGFQFNYTDLLTTLQQILK
jgi:uncharacterized protein